MPVVCSGISYAMENTLNPNNPNPNDQNPINQHTDEHQLQHKINQLAIVLE